MLHSHEGNLESLAWACGSVPHSFELLGSFYPLTFNEESYFSSGCSNVPPGYFFHFHAFLVFCIFPIIVIGHL